MTNTQNDSETIKVVNSVVDEGAGAGTGTGAGTKVLISPAVEYGMCTENLDVPIIDIGDAVGSEVDGKAKVVSQVLLAAEKWGVFQVVNHGIPLEVLENMIERCRVFHEQDAESKKQFYGGTRSKVVTYNFRNDFYKAKIPNWRETLCVNTLFTDGNFDPQHFPPICRDAMVEYIDHITRLGELLHELLAVALGLAPDYITRLESAMSWNLDCHYYPTCPDPEINIGSGQHTDVAFMTILLQDQIGGLQVVHENKWVKVQPHRGALVINIGDILEIMSNGKFKSVIHRVVANKTVPRFSIPFFFRGLLSSPRIYGPIKEVISEEKKAAYKSFTLQELYDYNFSRVVDQPGLDFFKL